MKAAISPNDSPADDSAAFGVGAKAVSPTKQRGAKYGGGGGGAGTVSSSGSGPLLRIPRENREMQTESSFYPSDVRDMTDQLTELHCSEFEQLRTLRGQIQSTMTEFSASIYDLFSFKDLMLAMSDRLPDMPVTDLLLISSKMFRRGSQLAQELGALFSIVFAENYVDEHFKFTEVRLLKKEVLELREQLEKVGQERDSYKAQFHSLSDGAKAHQNVVEALEDRNDVLEVRAAALEDQMAVLFQQLTDDFIFYNEDLLQKTSENIEVQEQLSATRSTFTQSIEAVQNRLRFFQNMLVEIQEDASMVNLDSAGSVKARIKALDVHVQHIIARFSSVKEGLVTTSQELVQALQEKRSVLNFAVQHLKLYDSQNQKLRASRALMHELRQRMTELERAVTHTFATGSYVRVDRGGDIHITPPTQSDGAQGRKSRYAVEHMRDITSIVEAASELGVQITAQLDTEDEQRTLLKSISLATPSTVRDGSSGSSARGGGAIARMAALTTPPGNGGGGGGGGTGGGGGAGTVTSPQQSYSAEQYQRLRDDFATKITFMREVYEERISDLESKVEAAAEKVRQAQNEAAAAVSQAIQQKKEDDDREAALKAKEKWEATKLAVVAQEQDGRHRALGELQRMEADLAGDDDFTTLRAGGGSNDVNGGAGGGGGGGGVAQALVSSDSIASPHQALRSYVSPLYRLSSTATNAPTTGGGSARPSGSASARIPIATSLPPAIARTAYSKEQQQRNAEVLRTMRRLTKVDTSRDEEEVTALNSSNIPPQE